MQEILVWFPGRKICWRRDRLPTLVYLDFPGGSDGKESTRNAGDLGSIPGSGRSPEGNGYPPQYSGLENSMDRGGWQATVHGFSKRWTRLNDFHFRFPLPGDKNNNSGPNNMGLVWVLKNNENRGLSIFSGHRNRLKHCCCFHPNSERRRIRLNISEFQEKHKRDLKFLQSPFPHSLSLSCSPFLPDNSNLTGKNME